MKDNKEYRHNKELLLNVGVPFFCITSIAIQASYYIKKAIILIKRYSYLISVDQQHMWCLPSARVVRTIRTTRAKHQHIDKKTKERTFFVIIT